MDDIPACWVSQAPATGRPGTAFPEDTFLQGILCSEQHICLLWPSLSVTTLICYSSHFLLYLSEI